ncbi:hypothetical protein GCM10025762_52300 [Haloechinothrix salitolerans]
MLRARMESLNLTETTLADRLGTSQTAVSNALTGQTRFDVFRTERYCDALEWPVEEFLHEYETTAPGVAGPIASDDEPASDQHDAPETDWAYTDPEESRRAEQLGKILRRLREHAGPDGGSLRQQVLADALGRSQSAITKAEHATRALTIVELEAFAWHLGSSLTAVYRQLRREAPRSTRDGS